MLDLLLKALEKERNVIKSTPIHFTSVCVISITVTGLVWYAAFSTALNLKTVTNEAYKERLESIESAVKSSPSQSLQVMVFKNDPNAEKLMPQVTNAAAMAYTTEGQERLFVWDIKSQSWK